MSYVNAHNDLHGEFGAYHCQRPRRSAADCQGSRHGAGACLQTRSGDAGVVAQFERDVVPLRENLYRRAMHLSHHHADAEDLVQETLLRAYSGFSSFELGTNVTAWLFRILTNAYIDGYRKKRRYPVQYSTDQITDLQLAAAYARSTPRGSRSAEDIALDSLPDDDITAAMQALPRQYRTVVYYADVEGLSYSEIMSVIADITVPCGVLLCNGANHPDSAEAMPGDTHV